MRVLEPFFNSYDDNYSELRTRCRDILQQEDSLSEIVQLVGRDSLSEDQKVRCGHTVHGAGCMGDVSCFVFFFLLPRKVVVFVFVPEKGCCFVAFAGLVRRGGCVCVC